MIGPGRLSEKLVQAEIDPAEGLEARRRFFARGVAAEVGAVIPSAHQQFGPRRLGVFIDDLAVEAVAGQCSDVEELAGIIGVGLVEPNIGEVDVLIGIDVVAQVAQSIAVVVTGGDQGVIARAIVGAVCVRRNLSGSPNCCCRLRPFPGRTSGRRWCGRPGWCRIRCNIRIATAGWGCAPRQ